MKTKSLLAILLVTLFTMVVATAQVGSNFGNPCLNTRKGPNTLKTNKHVKHSAKNRFNSHGRTKQNGNTNAYITRNQKKASTHRIKKNRIQAKAKPKTNLRKKRNKRLDRGN